MFSKGGNIMKGISMKQVYIREEFARKAKLMAVTEGKSLQDVLDEMLASHFEQSTGENDGK